MPGTLTWTPIPASPKQQAAAATFNARFTEFDIGIESHFNGTAARHTLSEIDSVTMDDHATAVPLNVGPTDARTRVLQLLTLIGNLADRGRATDAFQAVASLTTDLKTVGTVLGGRTAVAGGGTLVQRGASAEIGVGYVTAYGFGGLDTPQLRARPVAGQVQPVVAVEDAAGAVMLAGIFPTGLIYGGVNVQAKGQFVAGSGNRLITTPDGHLDAAQLAGTVAAAALPAHTGDVTTPGGSVATTVVQVGGLAAASVASGAGAANAATSDAVANPGRIVKADAFGNFRAGTITADLFGNASSASSVQAIGIQGTVMASQIDAAIARAANVPTIGGAGAVGTWPIAISGNAATATTAGTANAVAAGAVGNAGLANGAVDGRATLDRALPFRKLFDLAPYADGVTRAVGVNAGSYIAAVGGALVQRQFGGGSITIPSPTTGSQWTNIYVDAAGALQTSPGTIGGGQDTAPWPGVGACIGWTFLPQNGTALYSSQADWQAAGSPASKGYVVPQNVGGGGGGGGGGSAGAPVTSPFAIYGTNAGLGLSGNAQGVDLVLATPYGGATLPTVNGVNLNTLYVDPSRVRGEPAGASYADAIRLAITNNVIQLLQGATSTSMQIPATAGNPVFASVSNRQRLITTTLTSNALAGGAAGMRYIKLDLATSPATLTLETTQAVTLYQILLGTVTWTGTALDTAILDLSPVTNIFGSASLAPAFVANSNLNAAIGAITVNTLYPNYGNPSPSIAIAVPCPMRVTILWGAYITQAASPVNGLIALHLTPPGSATAVPQGQPISMLGVPAGQPLTLKQSVTVLLQPGVNVLDIRGTVVSGSFTYNAASIDGPLFRAGG